MEQGRMTLELKGHIPSKANCYRRNAKSGMRISVAAKAQLDALGFQINAQWHGKTPLVHPEIRVTFRFANAAQDRDNALKSLLDLLQTCGVIENDNVRKFNGTVVIEPAVITLPTREGVTVDITEAART
jgi:Holliday junction resolvase RusA-like endonuclease